MSSFLKLAAWEIKTMFVGPYPAFFVSRDIVADRNDAPAVRYYLYTKLTRFSPSKLIALADDHRELGKIKERWIESYEELPL